MFRDLENGTRDSSIQEKDFKDAEDKQQTTILDMGDVEIKQLLNEILVRVQDLESSIPTQVASNSSDAPIPLLSSSATLGEVIKVSNILIKRTFKINRVN